MLFSNYTVFLYIIAFILLFNGLKAFLHKRLLRNIFLIAGNVFVLLTIMREHTIIVLGVLGLFVFLFGKILQKKKIKVVFVFMLNLVILLFIVRNYPQVQNLLSGTWLEFINEPIISVKKIGLSYILFRFVHWLIESYRQNIKHADYFTFINYILFFPTFIAGPIDRYKNFHYWIEQPRNWYNKPMFFTGITRIFLGAVKTLLIVPLIINYATDYKLLIDTFPPIIALSLSLLAYSVYIYTDFSGYSDIAIGTAYLMGLKTPENFNNPYISKNLSEFWKRWHITFSTFLLAYVFKPSIQLFNYLMPNNIRIVNSILGYLVTFTICGLWHGTSVNFVIWGLWHGIGLSINKVWTSFGKNKLSIQNGPVYQSVSLFLTFSFVTIGWMFFHYSYDSLIEIFTIL